MGDYPHLDFVFSTVTAVVQSPLGLWFSSVGKVPIWVSLCSFPRAKQVARFPWHWNVCMLFVLFSIIISQARLNEICLVFCSGWRCAGLAALGFSVFCQLADMHICVSSFIADTERQVLIYCSSNNCAGICPVLTWLRLKNESASLKILVRHLWGTSQDSYLLVLAAGES